MKELMNEWLCGGVQGSIKRIQFYTAREGVTGVVYKSCCWPVRQKELSVDLKRRALGTMFQKETGETNCFIYTLMMRTTTIS